MLKVVNPHAEKRLEETRAFADRCGPEVRALFEEKLAYLEHFRDDTCVVELRADFAPYSFDFTLWGPEEDGQRSVWLSGGLIYFGPGESGVGGPQYSVDLEAATGAASANQHRWNVHT